MFLPSIKNNEIKLFLSREIRNGSSENQVADRIAAEIPIRLDFNRNADAVVFADGALYAPRNAASFNAESRRSAPFAMGKNYGTPFNTERSYAFNTERNCETPFNSERSYAPFYTERSCGTPPLPDPFRGFCGNARRPEPPDGNLCTPFGYKSYSAPFDASFLRFIDDETHISPRCRARE
jgi:hypothetical protein